MFSFLVFFDRLNRVWWYVVFFCTAAVYIVSAGDIKYKFSFGGIDYFILKYQGRQINRLRERERLIFDRAMYSTEAYLL